MDPKQPNLDGNRLLYEVAALVERVDELYGLYLDATAGFRENVEVVKRGQDRARRACSQGADLDQLPLFFGRGDPNDAENVMLHRTTQGAFKARNAKGGSNHVRMGQLLLVLLFEYWEVEHRPRMAKALAIPDQRDLKVPVFGDLRRLRHAVLHRQGILDASTVRRLGVITGFQAKNAIVLSPEAVEDVIKAIKAGLDTFVRDVTQVDPQHRTIWHVR
jgi:hypothetical protein